MRLNLRKRTLVNGTVQVARRLREGDWLHAASGRPTGVCGAGRQCGTFNLQLTARALNTSVSALPCCAGLLIAVACLSAAAAPLQRADVPADPAWVAHVDCDSLRSTAIGRYILTEMDKPEAQNKLAAFQAMFGFDLRKQLHGLTLYSNGSSPQDGVLVVYADFDPDHLQTLAKGANGYRSADHNQHLIHNWIDDKK